MGAFIMLQSIYVSGDAHTNTIEGFWSLVKRGISGVYHNVSAKHLQSYIGRIRLALQLQGQSARPLQAFGFSRRAPETRFGGEALFAALVRLRKKSLRLGTGILYPFAVVCDGA